MADNSCPSGWEALPAELLQKVLMVHTVPLTIDDAENGASMLMSRYWRSSTEFKQESQTRGVVCAVCRQWCASHDAFLARLKVSSKVLSLTMRDCAHWCVSLPCAYRHRPQQLHQGYRRRVADSGQPLRAHCSQRRRLR
eukprot:6780786-Pyramimonas_sp.AAC.1